MSKWFIAECILDELRHKRSLSIGVVRIYYFGVGEVVRIDAVAANGERWSSEHETYYQAVVGLAELMGEADWE